MAFIEFLKTLVGDRRPDLLDMHKAFSVIATIYLEDSLNLVNAALSKTKSNTEILAEADALFNAWQHELSSLKSAIGDQV